MNTLSRYIGTPYPSRTDKLFPKAQTLEDCVFTNFTNGASCCLSMKRIYTILKNLSSPFSELYEISKRAVIFPDSLALEPFLAFLFSPVVPFLYKRDIAEIFLDFLFKRFISERTPTGYQNFTISRGNYNNPALPVKEHSATTLEVCLSVDRLTKTNRLKHFKEGYVPLLHPVFAVGR